MRSERANIPISTRKPSIFIPMCALPDMMAAGSIGPAGLIDATSNASLAGAVWAEAVDTANAAAQTYPEYFFSLILPTLTRFYKFLHRGWGSGLLVAPGGDFLRPMPRNRRQHLLDRIQGRTKARCR